MLHRVVKAFCMMCFFSPQMVLKVVDENLSFLGRACTGLSISVHCPVMTPWRENSSAVAREHPQLRGLQPSVQIGKDGLWNVIILELIAWKDMSPGSLICIFTRKSKMTCRCLSRANHRLWRERELGLAAGNRTLLWTWVAGAKWAELFEEKTPVD